MAPRTEIFADPQDTALAAADWIAGLIAAHEGTFRIALSGGSTPRLLFGELSLRRIDWSKVVFYWIDERFVPHDHPDSNYRMAQETLLSHISVKPEQIRPMPVGGHADDAAALYEAELKDDYGAETLDPARPLFDLVLIGLGSDGHICSLFPNNPVLDEKTKWVAAVPTGRPEVRLTLTYPCVESSRITAFLVTGSDKAEAVRRVRAGDHDLPGGRLKPVGDVVWLLDQKAASLL
ncbi:6-phosphogluconolactonase [Rhizomicrobium palustre]